VVRGRKITDHGQMESTARDAESITFYGRRSLKINIPSIDKQYFAQYVADYEVKRRGRPQGMIEQARLLSHSREGGGYHGHQLARTLGGYTCRIGWINGEEAKSGVRVRKG